MKVVFMQDMVFEAFGPMYISSTLKQAGHKTELVIPQGNNGDYLREVKGADLLALSVTSSFHKWHLERAKGVKEEYDIPVIMGGPHPTFHPEVVQEKNVDYAVLGEGEKPILELVTNLESGKDTENIKGIWTKKTRNEMAILEDFNNIPYPDRELYYNKFKFLRDLPTKKFITTRGCPYSCSFCYNPTIKKLYKKDEKIYVRKLSVDRAIAEIKDVKEKYPLKTVRFSDDTFAWDKKWFLEFCRKYKKEINLPFTFLMIANDLDKEAIKKAKEAGCHSVFFAIESGDEYLRKKILNKPVSDDRIYQMGKWLHENDIKFGTYNMVGIPHETLIDAFKTVEMNVKIKTDYPHCSLVQPYPKTPLFDYCVNEGLLDPNFNPDDLTTMFDKSPIKLDDKEQFENLQKLFYVACKFPGTIPLIKKLIKKEHPMIYKLIMYFSFAHRNFNSFNAGMLNSILLGIKMRKLLFN